MEATMRACHVVGVAVFATMLGWLPGAHAQEQPIRIIFPFAAGGSGDGLARLIADKMRSALNRPAIVENRTGAAGRPAITAVKNAAPDGSTLLITPIAPMAVYQHVYRNLEYDPIKDFAPVSQIATFDFAVAVGPQVPAASLKELVAWVKADASRASFGSPGTGTLPHFFGLLFGRAAGIELRHVPYKGSAATLSDLAAGHVPMVFTTISDFVEMHKAKRIRILATAGAARSPFVPDVPTFQEAGFSIQGTSWFGAFAPAGTPREIVDRYSAIMAAAARMGDVRDRFLGWGLQPTGTSAAEFAAIQKADAERWGLVAKASGFSAD
ncbi:MAG: ABC transporter substrate-binding protein [Rhizobiales bacterium]|nr:ABC transporter substrate-binding protein [Hyphomicrobiales bacterium]